MATKRLKELLEALKSSPRDISGDLFSKHTLFCFCFCHNPLLSFPVIANGQPPTRQVIRTSNLATDPPSCTSYKLVPFILLQTNEKNLRKWLDNELEVMAKVRQVRFQYEKQIQV